MFQCIFGRSSDAAWNEAALSALAQQPDGIIGEPDDDRHQFAIGIKVEDFQTFITTLLTTNVDQASAVLLAEENNIESATSTSTLFSLKDEIDTQLGITCGKLPEEPSHLDCRPDSQDQGPQIRTLR